MMNAIEKSESIKAGLRQGFQDGSSKIARRTGDSLGKIAAGLEQHGVCSPSGKPKWAHEAIIPDEIFMAVQEEKINRSRNHEKAVAIKLIF